MALVADILFSTHAIAKKWVRALTSVERAHAERRKLLHQPFTAESPTKHNHLSQGHLY